MGNLHLLSLFFQIRSELGRIMEEPDINKAIKERFQGGWRASLLSLLKNSANTDVMEIMQEADGLAAEDENGGCELNLLSFTVTSFVPFY